MLPGWVNAAGERSEVSRRGHVAAGVEEAAVFEQLRSRAVGRPSAQIAGVRKETSRFIAAPRGRAAHTRVGRAGPGNGTERVGGLALHPEREGAAGETKSRKSSDGRRLWGWYPNRADVRRWPRPASSNPPTGTAMRYAICNETFEGWDHARVCRFVAELGYTGPGDGPVHAGPAHHRRVRRAPPRAAPAGRGLRRCTIIGLHWLLAKTEGLQLTSPDEAVRRRTADYLVELARCCRDLGGDILVFGSPAQRRIPAGATPRAGDGLRRRHVPPRPAGHRATAACKLCLEPLSPPEADFINTCRRGRRACSTGSTTRTFVLHLDVKAMATDEAPGPGADPPPRRPHRPLPRQRPEPARPRLRRHRLRADLPGPEGGRATGLGVGRGVRLLARPGDDRPREHPLHARVRGEGELAAACTETDEMRRAAGLETAPGLRCARRRCSLVLLVSLRPFGRPTAAGAAGRLRRGRHHAEARRQAGLPRRLRPEPQGDRRPRPAHGPRRRPAARRAARSPSSRSTWSASSTPTSSASARSCPASPTSSSPAPTTTRARTRSACGGRTRSPAASIPTT